MKFFMKIITSVYWFFYLLLAIIKLHDLNRVSGSELSNIYSEKNIIFKDEFDYFDLSKWSFDPNTEAHADEFQLYTNSTENSYTENGILHIRPTFSNAPFKNLSENYHSIYSARISTRESFAFRYGIVEIRAKVPIGDWLFPALWLMPAENIYGMWPQSGEIDLMESRGNLNIKDSNGGMVGVQQVSHTLHYGPTSDSDAWRTTHYATKMNFGHFGENFHIFKFIWTPHDITFYVDEEEVGIISPATNGFYEYGNFPKSNPNIWINGTKMAPFDQQFYIIINLAVGGTHFFPDSYINEGGKPWKNNSPNPGWDFWIGSKQWLPTWNLNDDSTHFLIDYVRVWDDGECGRGSL